MSKTYFHNAATAVLDPFQRSVHKLEKPGLLASSKRREASRPTREHPMIVSASELGTFLRCRVKHHWAYHCKLQRPVKGVPLIMGGVGHAIQEAWYKYPTAKRTVKLMRKLARAITQQTPPKELDTKNRDLLIAMLVGYAEWCRDDENKYADHHIGLDTCTPEDWFDLPLLADWSVRVRGKIDNSFVSTMLRKTRGALESKFNSAFRDSGIDNVIQHTVYLWAMRRKYPGFKRYQMFHQQLRKQMPGPRVTAPLFKRDLIERTDDEIDQWEVDTRNVALDMLDGAVYPSPQESCSWSCDYTIPCLLRGNRADLRHVLRTEFTTKPERTS